MSCNKIQKPAAAQNQRHGKLILDITCDNETTKPIKFDATKGDLKLHLICEDTITNDFQVLNDKDAINEINRKIEYIQTQINELNEQINNK